MTKQELFDRYSIIRALIYFERDINLTVTNNALHTPERKQELVQRNNSTIQGVIDRLIDKDKENG